MKRKSYLLQFCVSLDYRYFVIAIVVWVDHNNACAGRGYAAKE